VLIAFVVVAAVFSYGVLGAGFFTTQKSQETVHTSVAQASSAVEIAGPVMVNATGTENTLGNISFYLQLSAGGSSVDMSKVVYTVSSSNRVSTVKYGDGALRYSWVKEVTSNTLLEPREMLLVDIGVGVADPGLGWSTSDVTVNDKIQVQVQPPIGAPLTIDRTLPAYMAPWQWYEVY
jgi:flagellin FlaB